MIKIIIKISLFFYLKLNLKNIKYIKKFNNLKEIVDWYVILHKLRTNIRIFYILFLISCNTFFNNCGITYSFLSLAISLHFGCKCDDFFRCTATQIHRIITTCYTLLVLVVDNTAVQGRAGKCAALESHLNNKASRSMVIPIHLHKPVCDYLLTSVPHCDLGRSDMFRHFLTRP